MKLNNGARLELDFLAGAAAVSGFRLLHTATGPEALTNVSTIIFDCDGVLWKGASVVHNAVEVSDSADRGLRRCTQRFIGIGSRRDFEGSGLCWALSPVMTHIRCWMSSLALDSAVQYFEIRPSLAPWYFAPKVSKDQCLTHVHLHNL